MTARRLHCALFKRGVGCDDGDRRVLARTAFGAQREVGGCHLRRRAAPAEFLVLLERRRPEMRSVADHRRADGIDHRKRADGDAVARLRRGRADAALERRGGRAESRADAAEREVGARGFRRLVAELAIGRIAAPVLVAAIEQVEQDRAPARSAPRASRIRKPRPCSRSQACTPEAASSPKAEPPDSTMASMPSTVCAGSSKAVSRVPGPPPRTSTLATTAASNTIAVTPEPSLASPAWPTRRPGISVMRLRNAMMAPKR